jgi:3-deoxy-D-manno-octulosonic acid (KDO) 8-phosphate synthase
MNSRMTKRLDDLEQQHQAALPKIYLVTHDGITFTCGKVIYTRQQVDELEKTHAVVIFKVTHDLQRVQ